MSQSPLTGQFNFYPVLRPSNIFSSSIPPSQSPLTGQFNFYRGTCLRIFERERGRSQSPLTGQFNFYD